MAAALIEKWYRFTDWIGDHLFAEPVSYSFMDWLDEQSLTDDGLTDCCDACDDEPKYDGLLSKDYPA